MRTKKLFRSLLMIFVLLTSCQPTPENVTVIGKGDDRLQEAINASPAIEAEYTHPNVWAETIEGLEDNISVVIDANVVVPDTTVFPVVRVEPDEITQSDADKIMNVLTGDALLKTEGGGYTREEIEKEIIAIQTSISDPNSDFNQLNAKGTPEYDEKLAEKEAEIATLQEMWKSASSDDQITYAPRTFKQDEYGFMKISGDLDVDDAEYAFISIIKDSSTYYTQAVDYYENQPYVDLRRQTDDLNDLNISIDEAQRTAEQLLSDMGIEGMTCSYVCSAYETMFIEKNILDAPQCLVLYYTRTINNTPVTYRENRLDFQMLSKQYAPYWQQEYIQVAVNDKGVCGFTWVSPTTVTDTLNSNVELMPFEEIQDIFRSNIAKNIDLEDDPAAEQYKIQIDEIKLGLTMVKEKDSIDGYMLIPTWTFFGEQINCYPEDPSLGSYSGIEYSNGLVAHCFLAINAIDGSIIDPALGY